MKKFLIVAAVLVGLAVGVSAVVGSYLMGVYNGFVNESQAVTTSWAQVETQYQRRYDLIPQLVQATRGVMRQEQAVFKSIADARKGYAGTAPGSVARVGAANSLDSALARLMVVIENYPNLKSDATVRDLMNEMAGTENRINVARYRYNEMAQGYNTSVNRFPGRVLAGMFNFKEKPYFQSVAEAAQAPKVDVEVKL